LSMMDLFRYPDISSLAQRLAGDVVSAAAAVEERAGEMEIGKARRRQRLEKSRGTTGGER
jgi:hypothetical protein